MKSKQWLIIAVVLLTASLGFASVSAATEPVQAPEILANFGIHPVAVDDTPNMCIQIKGHALSIRALPSLDVPPLGFYYKWMITAIDGTVTLKTVDNPGTPVNEARSNGLWARIGKAAYVPIELDKDNAARASVLTCME